MDLPSLAGQGMIAVDLESCDPDLKERGSSAHKGTTIAFIAGAAVATEAGFKTYLPIAHENSPDNLPKEAVLGWLKEQMALPQPKVGANLLYDLGLLAEVDIKVEGPLYDIQVAEPLLKEDRFSYGLEALSKDYLGVGKQDEQLDEYLIRNFGKKNPKQHIWRAPPAVVAPYAIGDVVQPLQIFSMQRKELEKQNLWDLFLLESKLIPMLAAMRKRGVRVDLDRAQQMLDRMTGEQTSAIAAIKRHAGVEVSPWETKSIAKVYDSLGVEYPRTPKTKAPSFTKDWLAAQPHPVSKLILEARRLDKMRGTFLQGCILENHWKGRVHCQFNQLRSDDGGAVSGRFSSSKPNLQFIPVRTDEGKLLRAMFLPDEGQDWYKFDYSQIEYRLIVHDAASNKLKGAQEVADIYNSDPDADFHKIVAEMTGLDRVAAKTVNFGLAYGEGVKKLSAQLGLSLEDGEALLNEYHRRAPFMRPLASGAMSIASQTGLIETVLKRRRRFDLWALRKRGKNGEEDKVTILRHRVAGSQRAFCHKALNARVQGSAADIMKKAMVDVWESGVIGVLGVPQLTVHDELDGSVPPGGAGVEALKELKEIMEKTLKLLVPLRVDGSVGASWGDTKDVTLGKPTKSQGRGGDMPDK